MSDGEPKDESTRDSERLSEEQPSDSDQAVSIWRFNWKTDKIADQQFRFTGKYYTGVILNQFR